MSYFKSQLQEEESSRGFDGKSELDEGLFSFRDDEISSPHLTWSTFDDLDDSGHFTASPDGERTFSGSSPSHSPCPTSAQLVLQMQNQENNNVNPSSQFKQHPLSKPLISPRSIMTVTVPHTTSSSVISFPSSHDRSSHKLLQPSECSSASGTVAGDDIQPSHRRNSNHSASNVPAQPVSLQEEMAEALQSQAFSPEPKKSQSRDAPPITLPFPKSNDESSEYLRSMLENFNCLYMEKLRMIDDLAVEGDADQKRLLMEKKTNMLEQWAKDVCVQNMVLVHTVEELEREANRKVSALQQKINESTQLAKEHMTMISKYEQQVKLLLKNHSDTEESNLVLKIELEKLKSECRRVRDRMNLLLKDNESVITLVCRIRDMGVWDVNGLELQRSSFDQIFGLYPNLVGSEVQTVFTKEKAKQAQYTEERAVKLENQLDDLHKSQKETQSCSLQKDRKIEELETEINNLSNKVQYCEQECNDYKRSLLETQEKLLEATRRLNATPKISKPTTSPEVNEMTELIRELRDVKSQLNTAVDEKQTARDESNYFKKELSERLKEMHDIQNVFHSLATEVVSSRAAFQQVQEKEVQLQSLKSEIHTYQSRCADADDTIRKKEEEIRQLQNQMNQIHKKKKKQKSYLSSTSNSIGGTELTSDKPASTMLSFYQSNLRNISASSKIPVRKSITSSIRSRSGNFANKHKTVTHNVLTQTSEQGSNKKRPPWNTNFKKSMGLLSIPASELPVVSRSSLSKETQSSTRQLSLHRANSQDSLTWKGIHRSYDDITTDASSFIKTQQAVSDQIYSNYSNNKGMAYNSSLNPKEIKEDPQKKRLKLPKIESKTRAQKKSPVTSAREGATNGEKLPMVDHVLTKSSKTKGPPKKLDNPVLKNLIDNPLAHTPRLNELINAVVETSKQLLGNGVGKSVLEKGSLSGLKITAAHYRKNRNKVGRQKNLVRRVKSSDKNAEVNRSKSEAINSPKLPRKHHSSTLVTPSKDKDEVKIIYESPRDVNAFLNGLPRESQEDIVKGWIAKSSSQLNNSKNVKRVKTPLSARRPSLKVMRHLATRRCPRQTQAPVKTKANDEDESKTKMFDLEDEWGKVFANLECSLPGSGDGTSKVDKLSGELSGMSEIVEEQQTPFPEPTMESSSSSAKEAAKSEENPCKEESMQELLDRLAAEKLELEERYKKELHDRDIEIRMQKVTIQHLQDAYVALKRGQPIPIPQNVTGNRIMVNGSTNGHHNNNVLDV